MNYQSTIKCIVVNTTQNLFFVHERCKKSHKLHENCYTFEDILDIDQICNLFSAIGLKYKSMREKFIISVKCIVCMYI